jgi:hypothetical protein
MNGRNANAGAISRQKRRAVKDGSPLDALQGDNRPASKNYFETSWPK